MSYLKDHFEAMDFIFDLVKNSRRISKSFIFELHQLITSHQDTTEAIDQNGNIVSIPLIKGAFKRHPNNPRREDGTVFLHSPPEQVDSEIDNLIKIYDEIENRGIHPVIKAAFFHHSFTQIHPFQDGNGRMARLLSSLILIKDFLFPLTVLRNEKRRYIESLEQSDNKNYQPLVDLFCDVQIRYIESALNLNTVTNDQSFNDVLTTFTVKAKKLKTIEEEQRVRRIDSNRNAIFGYCLRVMNELSEELQNKLYEIAKIKIESANPGAEKYYYFAHQIGEYATRHSYYFNASLPRGWIKINIRLNEKKNYNLILSMHHYGYDDSTIALGAFLEFVEDKKMNVKGDKSSKEFIALPLDIRPLTFSVEKELKELEINTKEYLKDVVKTSLAHLSNEL